MPDTPVSPLPAAVLSRPLVALLAAAAGASVANIYYAQPILSLIAGSFNVHGGAAAQVAAATQLGYAAGLVLLVPLGDSVDRRRLILWQTAGLVVALACAAAAPSLLALVVASVAIGICSTIAQQVVPIAAEMAAPSTRGRTVGTVMSGLLAGILLGRTLSGAVASLAGWRASFGMGMAIAAVMGVALWALLPRQVPQTSHNYASLMRSLAAVVRQFRLLRRASIVQGLLFAAFSAFWATLTLLLASPAYHLGPFFAGLFGVIGLVGVCVAPLAGTLTDRRGPDGVTRIGVCGVLAAFVVMGAVPGIVGLVAGVLLLDAGMQLAMVSQQSVILALDDAARGRINTVYVTSLFLGGAFGSMVGSLAWTVAGWPGVCGFGVALALTALAVHRWGFSVPDGDATAGIVHKAVS